MIFVGLLVLASTAFVNPVGNVPGSQQSGQQVWEGESHPPKGDTNGGEHIAGANADQSAPVVRVILPPESQEEARRHQTEHDEKAATDGWMIFLTGLVAMATVAQFVALWRGLITSERQMRAYVYVDSINISNSTAGEAAEAWFANWPASLSHIRNSGQTPASRLIHVNAINVSTMQNPTLPEIPSVQDTHATSLGAGGLNNKNVWMNRPLTALEIVQIQDNLCAIYVYGTITYRDIFGRGHETKYRLYFSGMWPPPPNATLLFAAEGNEST